MSLFRRGGPAEPEERSTINLSQYAQLWQQQFYGYTPVPVSVQRALTHSASSACIDVLATSVSTLPVDVVRQQGNRRVPVSPTPQLIASPSVLTEPDVWMYQLVDSMLTDGNGFGLVVSQTMGRATGVELLDAATVTDRRVENGVPQVRIGAEIHQLWPFGDVWHVPGKYTRAGSPFAESPVARAASTIGAAIAARDFGSRFFGDGGHPGGIISSDQPLTSEQAKDIKAAFLNAVNGTREPAVLGGGLNYQPINVDPNDSQFLDLMRFAIEEACRFWRVPPNMVYAATSGQNVTYSNATQADLHYLKHSLEGLLIRVEKALTKQLPRPQFVRFNRNAFLRSDPETRWGIWDKRLRNKTTSVNEVRAAEDEEPFDESFDEPGIPGVAVDAPGFGGSDGNAD